MAVLPLGCLGNVTAKKHRASFDTPVDKLQALASTQYFLDYTATEAGILLRKTQGLELIPMNRRITESQNVRGWKGPLWVI